jgi:hypothetical protein
VKWESRLVEVERIVAHEVEAEKRWAQWQEETERRVNEMLGHVPVSL